MKKKSKRASKFENYLKDVKNNLVFIVLLLGPIAILLDTKSIDRLFLILWAQYVIALVILNLRER